MFYLNNLCCLCLAKNKKFTSRSSINPNAEDMLQRIIPEFVQKTSEIERQICDGCLGSLTAVFEFRRRCLKNIIIFDEYSRKVQESCKSLTTADIKLDIKKEINEEIILEEDKCFLEDDVRSNFVEISIKLENSFNKESNEEQDGNDQKSNVPWNIFHGSDTDKTNEPSNQNIDYDEPSKCTKCGEESSNLKRNIDSPYKCKKCERIGTRNKSKKALYAKKPHACNICNKSFRCISDLKVHNRAHTGERPFSCSFCKKGFTQICSLKVHQRVHTKERPYVCNICQKSFAEASTLRNHKFIHSEKGLFECDVCQERYKRPDNLRRHKMSHVSGK